MITFWQQEEGKLVRKDDNELDTSKNTWVDARSVTRDDIRTLEELYKIDPENILDILDPDELSRIEHNDETGYTLTIIRLPVFLLPMMSAILRHRWELLPLTSFSLQSVGQTARF